MNSRLRSGQEVVVTGTSGTVAMAVARNPRSGLLVSTCVVAGIEAGVLAAGGVPALVTAALVAVVATGGLLAWWHEGRAHRRLVRDALVMERAEVDPLAEVVRAEQRLTSLGAAPAASKVAELRAAVAARREVEALAG